MITNEDMARWCGFKHEPYWNGKSNWGKTTYPNGITASKLTLRPFPNFTIDLNAWEKWVFPKIKGHIIIERCGSGGWHVIFEYKNDLVTWHKVEGSDDTICSALTKAIEPIVNGDK